MSTLEIKDLHVSIETEQGSKEILKGVSLTINTGETHAIMGPNGSGKSTLASTIAGHPRYMVDSGSITLDGEDVLAMSVDQRARAGLFLAMQYPVEIPGVTMTNFLRTAKTALDGEAPSLRTGPRTSRPRWPAAHRRRLRPAQRQRRLLRRREEARRDPAAGTFKPKFAIMDETDSGLDVDALKVVSEGVNRAHEGGMGTLLITHYTRILRYIKPEFVHVFVDGHIAEEGGPELADRLEEEGYDRYCPVAGARPVRCRKAKA